MNNNLGKIISELRNKRNYTQKELADKLNVSDKAVSRWETGMSIPHVDTLVRISKLFKISLQDLIIATESSNEGSDELVQDIIKEFERRDDQKSKLIAFILAIAFFAIVFLIISIIFINSYNRFKVYDVGIEGDDIRAISGIYVETNVKDSLYIGVLDVKNYIKKESDTIIVELYYLDNNKKQLLNTYSDLENIRFVNYDSYIEIDDLSKYQDKLYVKVIIIDKDNNKREYVGKLDFTLNFSNNKIAKKEKNVETNAMTLSKEEITKRLTKNGFNEIDGALLKNDMNIRISYLLEANVVNINYDDKNYIYRYSYDFYNNLLKVKIYNNENVEVENYMYDILNDKVVNCVTGKCNGYEEAKAILNNNVLKYLYN
jgi:transcriptional regulator with XRE-family HTH domain